MQTSVLATAVVQAQMLSCGKGFQKEGRGRMVGNQGRGRGRYITSLPHPSDLLGLNQRVYCQEEGHWEN